MVDSGNEQNRVDLYHKLIELSISAIHQVSPLGCEIDDITTSCPKATGAGSPTTRAACMGKTHSAGVRDNRHAGIVPTVDVGDPNFAVVTCPLTGGLYDTGSQSPPVIFATDFPSDVKETLLQPTASTDWRTALNIAVVAPGQDERCLYESTALRAITSDFTDRPTDDSSSSGFESESISRSSSGTSQSLSADSSDVELLTSVGQTVGECWTKMPAHASDATTLPPTLNSSPASAERKILHGRRRKRNPGSMNPMLLSRAVPAAADDLSVLQQYVPACLEQYGFCVVDRFVGEARAHAVADDVRNLYDQGLFVDGRLTNRAYSLTTVRGDRVYWLERENAEQFVNLRKVLVLCDSMFTLLRGRLKPYNITSRTKAMLACYPGEGRGYRRHVDNPNQDGRCITCIYYLNPDWCPERDGGLLRLCPSSLHEQTVDLEPRLDRLLLFWSDHRTPHEVQPSFRNRYAVTVWYFDEVERHQARTRFAQQGSQEDSTRLQHVDLQPVETNLHQVG